MLKSVKMTPDSDNQDHIGVQSELHEIVKERKA